MSSGTISFLARRRPTAVDGHAQEAAAGDDMILRRRLAKILEGGQRPLAELHLVKDHQRLFSDDGLPRNAGEDGHQTARLNALLKSPGQARIRLKIKIGDVLIVLLAKLKQRISLAYLPRTLQN